MADNEKLVRDHIPKIMRQNGATPITRQAKAGELPELLMAKLREEVEEFRVSGEADELADIIEVVYAIAASKGLTVEQLEKLRKHKRLQRGGFSQRIVLIMGDAPTPAA